MYAGEQQRHISQQGPQATIHNPEVLLQILVSSFLGRRGTELDRMPGTAATARGGAAFEKAVGSIERQRCFQIRRDPGRQRSGFAGTVAVVEQVQILTVEGKNVELARGKDSGRQRGEREVVPAQDDVRFEARNGEGHEVVR